MPREHFLVTSAGVNGLSGVLGSVSTEQLLVLNNEERTKPGCYKCWRITSEIYFRGFPET
jgi:hypothetical protein